METLSAILIVGGIFMERKYTLDLLNMIHEKERYEVIEDVNVLVKPIPDCDESGCLDPRYYQDNKKMITMLKWMPKGLMKFDTSEKSIMKLREMFNGVKSIPVTSNDIVITSKQISGKDNNDIPLRIYQKTKDGSNRPVLFYIHGGGFFGGNMDVIEQLVKLVVEKFDIVAVSIEYRLAPENPYPCGHDDCYEGMKWIYENIKDFKGNPQEIFVGGDSAGGNLAQYCTTKSLEEKLNIIKGQILLYPTVNMGGIHDKYTAWNLDKYEMNPKYRKAITLMMSMMGGDDGMTSMLTDILKTKDVLNKYLTPYSMDAVGLPPTLITVGEYDFLKVECLAYAKKLVDADVDVKTILYKGLGHAYGDNVGVYPQSEDCAIEMGKFIIENWRGR